jgi:hypothetical protein
MSYRRARDSTRPPSGCDEQDATDFCALQAAGS